MTEQTQSPATDDLRIRAIKQLMKPRELMTEIPVSPDVAETVAAGRTGIHRVLVEEDDRLVAIVGPCSIHDADAAREYAEKLSKVQQRLADNLLIVMASVLREASHDSRLEGAD